MRIAGLLLLAIVAAAAVAAPVVAPHDPSEAFRGYAFAPPMRPHVIGDDGEWRAPFVFPVRLVDRLERRYEEDLTRPVPLRLLARGRLVVLADESEGPWLPLGADSAGRDVLSRLLHGARTSLGVAAVAALIAILLGALVGGAAGYAGGIVDAGLMWLAELIIVLPAIYVVLALRAALPLVLPAWAVFLLMAGIFGAVGWPWVARGVRGIVASERTREYADAARSLGAGHGRVLFKHLLPASRAFVATQAVLLLPAFILAEATLSFVGLGFPDTIPSWGSMLLEASDVSAIGQFPWTLVPAGAIFVVTLAANLVLGTPPVPPRDTEGGARTRTVN